MKKLKAACTLDQKYVKSRKCQPLAKP